MQKTKLVVWNENMLGYIHPLTPDYVNVLHGSILKGFVGCQFDSKLVTGNNIRLASAQDFDEYRCSFGYFNNPELYEFKTT